MGSSAWTRQARGDGRAVVVGERCAVPGRRPGRRAGTTTVLGRARRDRCPRLRSAHSALSMTDGNTRVMTKESRIRWPGSGVTMSMSVESNGEHTASARFARLGQGARRMPGRVCLITVTTGPVLERNCGREQPRDDLGSVHRAARRALGARHRSRGSARPRLKRTQRGAGLRNRCRRVGRCGLRLDAPRTAVPEDLNERLSRSPAPEDLQHVPLGRDHTDRAAGCGSRHRPVSETASDNLPLGRALTANSFDARRGVARTIGMTPGARTPAVAISCVDKLPSRDTLAAHVWRLGIR